MTRVYGLFLTAALGLAACAPTPAALGPDGQPLPQAYRIRPSDEGQITFRMLDAVNSLRGARGLAALQLNAQLNAAAETHARDMATQNRAWHFGSDGSSPLDRARRAGYPAEIKGENISETYETELQTLSAWMDVPDTANVIMDAQARDLGFGWYQESSGKIWWTLVTGG